MQRNQGIYPTHRPLPVALAEAQARRQSRAANAEPEVFSRLVTALCITAVFVVAAVLALA